MKIASLLPSATEIVCLLGLEDELVGITHECDYPPSIRSKPVLTSSVLDHRGATGTEIDRHIKELVHAGSSVYDLDHALLERLDPDLILTQELCEVCAVSYRHVQRAVRELPNPRRVLSLEPPTLDEVLETILLVGRETGRDARAIVEVNRLRSRIEAVAAHTRDLPRRPRVCCMEWMDPPYATGHWVPGMVDLAGGTEVLGVPGGPSRTVSWDEIRAAGPEVLVLMPCGYNVPETLDRVRDTRLPGWWPDLPAVRDGRVYAVNGSAYFNRPGPRLVDGLEILAQLLHPQLAIRTPAEYEAVPVPAEAFVPR